MPDRVIGGVRVGEVRDKQDNWSDSLTMAEFCYNNTLSSTIGMTPFFANYGYHPRYELVTKPDATPPPPAEIRDYASQLQKLEEYIQAEMKYAQAIASDTANASRSALPAFKVGDEVWLLRRNFSTLRPSNKLDYKRVGRFTIIEKISSHAYKLDLPASMKVHPVFHVSLLEPASSDPLVNQVQPLPPPVEVDDEDDIYEVESIENSRRYGKARKLQYLVRWKGYHELEWEPFENVKSAARLLHRFHAAYPKKPRPRRLPDLNLESDDDWDSSGDESD